MPFALRAVGLGMRRGGQDDVAVCRLRQHTSPTRERGGETNPSLARRAIVYRLAVGCPNRCLGARISGAIPADADVSYGSSLHAAGSQ